MMDESIETENKEINAFKQAHMRYRRRPNDPNYVGDVCEMIDFEINRSDERILHIPSPTLPTSFSENTVIYSGPLYSLVSYPGFLMAPNALSPKLQLLLAYSALSTYCEFPHRTNLECASHDGNSTLWEQWKESRSFIPSTSKQSNNRSIQKLSWSTIGYHYNWTQRSYNLNEQSPMPLELHQLASLLAFSARHRHDSSITSLPYEATAGIVNFYRFKSVMGGHRDDLESALHQPVISVSVGSPAVFLFGGPSLNDSPVLPIVVRPGDVMLFGGVCRLNYHSMARLLPQKIMSFMRDCNPHQLQVEHVSDKCNLSLEQRKKALFEDENGVLELSALEDYLSQHRININLRQVYDSTPTEENVDAIQ